MSEKHFGNVQPLLDNEEHEHFYEPATKRVLPYGWDGSEKRTLNVDSSGQLNVNVVSGSAGLATISILNADEIGLATVNINNNINIGNFSGSTIYAVVNTSAVGNTNALSTLLAGPNQIGSVTVSNFSSIGLATVDVRNTVNALATVNVSNTINSVSTVVLNAGISQIGSVTISNMQPLVAGTSQIGSVTVSSTGVGTATIGIVRFAEPLLVGAATIGIVRLTPLIAGTAQVGSVTVSSQGPGTAQIGSVTVSSIGVGTATIGIVRLAAQLAMVAGTAQIGSVTISNPLPTGAAWIGLATTAIGAGTAQIGSVTVSSIGVGTATVGIARVAEFSKTFLNCPVALSATNLSGSTIFVSAASKKFHITNLMLSCSSIVGISILSGATYLVGGPTVRMQFAAQSGIINTGSIGGPVLHALADESNFLIATDTAAPIAGSVSWYEEIF